MWIDRYPSIITDIAHSSLSRHVCRVLLRRAQKNHGPLLGLTDSVFKFPVHGGTCCHNGRLIFSCSAGDFRVDLFSCGAGCGVD